LQRHKPVRCLTMLVNRAIQAGLGMKVLPQFPDPPIVFADCVFELAETPQRGLEPLFDVNEDLLRRTMGSPRPRLLTFPFHLPTLVHRRSPLFAVIAQSLSAVRRPNHFSVDGWVAGLWRVVGCPTVEILWLYD
jgi:hypothetical protein